MNLLPYSFNGTQINSGNFRAKFTNAPMLTSARPVFIPSGSSLPPYLSGKEVQGKTISILFSCLGGTVGDDFDTLKALFDTVDNTRKILVAQDQDDSNRSWQVTCLPIAMSEPDGATFTVTLAMASPFWIIPSANEVTETTWNVTATGGTALVNINIGNVSAYPVIEVSPQVSRNAGFAHRQFILTYNYTGLSAADYLIDVTDGGLNTTGLVADGTYYNTVAGTVGINDTTIAVAGTAFPVAGMGYYGTEQIAWTGNTGGTLLTGVTRGLAGTTAAGHSAGGTIFYSRIKADGSDIRVRFGTTEGNESDVPYYLSTTSLAAATALKIWAVRSYAPRVSGRLATSITDSATSITLGTSIIGAAGFNATGGTVLIESEKVTYTSYNSTTRTLSGCVRGALNSTAAAHAANVQVIQIPVAYVYYGNPLAEAPTENLTYKPIFNLATSTNTSWVYESFRASNQKKYVWTAGVTKVSGDKTTVTYSVDQDPTQQSDPAVEMGVALMMRNALAKWTATFPFGFSAVTFTNIDRQYLPTNAGQIISYYQTITSKKVTAITPNASTWATENKTHTPSTPHRFLVFQLTNASVNNFPKLAAMNVATVTATLSNETTSSLYGVPYVNLQAREDLEYEMDATITNNTTGKAIKIKTEIPFGETLQIDTLNKTVTALWNNRSRYPDFQTTAIRDEWLALVPGNNTLQYDESGVGDVDIVIKWRGRNN